MSWGICGNRCGKSAWLGIFCSIRKWHSIPFHDNQWNWTINKYDLNIFLQCRDSHTAVKYLDIITHRLPLIGILKSYSLILIYPYVKDYLSFSTSTSPLQKKRNLIIYNFAKIKIPIYLYQNYVAGFSNIFVKCYVQFSIPRLKCFLT